MMAPRDIANPPDDWIALPDLLAAVPETTPRNLWEWRRRGLFPFEPMWLHIRGTPGSVSYLPPKALPLLQRLVELRQESRDPNHWFWRLWLDPTDYPIDMKGWVVTSLISIEKGLSGKRSTCSTVPPGEELSLLRKSGFRHTVDRIRNAQSRRTVFDFLFAFALGNDRPGIYSATPEQIGESNYDHLLSKLVGLPTLKPVIAEKYIDRGIPYWIARIRRMIARAPDRYIEQARHDWRAINRILEAAALVDWNKAPPLQLIGAEIKTDPPSWRRRKQKRARPLPPPDILNVDLLWDRGGRLSPVSRDQRAIALAMSFGMVFVLRRLFSRTQTPGLPDQVLGIVQQWIDGLPRRLSASKK